jgi:ribosome maturation factor RimP
VATDDKREKGRRRKPSGERNDRGARGGEQSADPSIPVRRRPLSNEARELLRQWGEEACAAYELVLWDMDALERGGVWLVRYFVDRIGGIGPGKGITIEECALVNRYVVTVMDVDERMPTAYELEVSSPGIERDLKRVDHWTSMVGQQVRAILREAKDGRAMWEGELVAVSEDGSAVELKVSGEASNVTLPLAEVKRAHIKYDFGTTTGQGDEA